MYDSANNDDSEVYGDKAKHLHSTLTKLDSFHDQRQGYLRQVQGDHIPDVFGTASRNDCSQTLTHTGRATVHAKAFQAKAHPNTFDTSFEKTYDTLFGRLDTRIRPERTQHLRNEDLSGKNYNIVTHAKITEWPSEPVHRQHNKVLAHPSQASLEGSRNLQGTLHPMR